MPLPQPTDVSLLEAAQPAPADDGSDDDSFSAGAITGIVVGSVVVAVLLLALVVWVMSKRNRKMTRTVSQTRTRVHHSQSASPISASSQRVKIAPV